MSYVTIDEKQLQQVLDGNNIETRQREDIVTSYRF